MFLYKKISIIIKNISPNIWLFIKSTFSLTRHLFKNCDFPVTYYPSLKTVYLQVPKTATSTTSSLILKKLNIPFDEENYHSIHALSSMFLIKEKQLQSLQEKKDIFTFAFVRNPYTRLISCYLDKIKTEQDSDILNDYYGVFTTDMRFSEFIEKVCRIPNFWANTHFKSQTSFIYLKGHKEPNFIGKFENYVSEIKIIIDKLGLPNITKSFNVTSGIYKLDDWYDDKLARKVYRRYKNDFEKFGYSKNIK